MSRSLLKTAAAGFTAAAALLSPVGPARATLPDAGAPQPATAVDPRATVKYDLMDFSYATNTGGVQRFICFFPTGDSAVNPAPAVYRFELAEPNRPSLSFYHLLDASFFEIDNPDGTLSRYGEDESGLMQQTVSYTDRDKTFIPSLGVIGVAERALEKMDAAARENCIAMHRGETPNYLSGFGLSPLMPDAPAQGRAQPAALGGNTPQ